MAAAAVLAAAAAAPALADRDDAERPGAPAATERRAATFGSGSDLFAAGSGVRVDAAVAGDVVAAGGSVEVGAPVGGDAVVLGGTVRVDDRVGHSLYAAGGQVTVNGRVGRSARLAGGQVELARGARVDGNVSVAGGRVLLTGDVGGDVQASGGSVRLDGAIGGDVVVSAGTLELGPQTRIAGRLRHVGGDVQRHVDAQVAGGIDRLSVDAPPREPPRARTGGWVWTVGLLVLAAVLAAALPALAARLADALAGRPGASVALGFAVLAGVPVAAVVALVSIVGIPLGLLGLALYPPLLLLGYVGAGMGLGLALMRPRTGPAGAGRRMLAAVLGVLAISLLARLPWVGGFVVLLALVAGIGALLLPRRAPAAASPSPAAA